MTAHLEGFCGPEPCAGPPIPGATVNFKVLTGPNTGQTGVDITDANGEATFTYTDSAGPGTDELQAFIGTQLESNKVEKIWLPDVIEVDIDIKFCSNPNGFNCKKAGVVPLTIFGADDLDVTQIDIASLQLCLASNPSVCTGAPTDSKPPEDRGGPADIGAAQCTVIEDVEQRFLNPDGLLDLDVGFDSQQVVGLIGCGSLNKKDASPTVILTGQLLDGTDIVSVPVGDVGIDQLFIQNN